MRRSFSLHTLTLTLTLALTLALTRWRDFGSWRDDATALLTQAARVTAAWRVIHLQARSFMCRAEHTHYDTHTHTTRCMSMALAWASARAGVYAGGRRRAAARGVCPVVDAARCTSGG